MQIVLRTAMDESNAGSQPASSSTVPSRNNGALILGGDCGALSAIRSLGRRGIPVQFLKGSHGLASYSRFASEPASWPGSESELALTRLLSLGSRDGFQDWVLLPDGDTEVRLVAQQHEKLSALFRLATPDWNTIKWAANKQLTYQKAEELKIPYPKTFQVKADGDLPRDLLFPLILKPAAKEGANELTSAKAWRIDSRQELEQRFLLATRLAGSAGLVLQEFIPGGGMTQFSYAAVWKDGEPAVSMVVRRTRQHPSESGTGCFVETVMNATVEELAERFLRSISYFGPVEMEFKFDARDGKYKLLDVNPRLWTWNALGSQVGADFPLAAYKVALKLPLERLRVPAGLAWMYVAKDLVEVAKLLLKGDLSWSELCRQLSANIIFATWSSQDPLPFMMHIPVGALRAFKRRASVAFGK